LGLIKLSSNLVSFQIYHRFTGNEVVPVDDMKAYSRSRSTAPHILNLATEGKKIFSIALQALYLLESAIIEQGGLVGPRAAMNILNNKKISCLCLDSNPAQSSA
jgi:hypothetical protein